MLKKKIISLAVGTVLLLLIPLALTIRDGNVPNVGWNWSPGDFVFAFVLIFGTGLAYLIISSKSSTNVYRGAVGIALGAGFLLIWINGAVGIIGSEDNPVNLLYLAVLAFGFLGAIVARLKPRRMSRVLFSMAIAIALIPVIAFIIVRPTTMEPPGLVRVLAINTFFVVMFVGSGLLFRQASIESKA